MDRDNLLGSGFDYIGAPETKFGSVINVSEDFKLYPHSIEQFDVKETGSERVFYVIIYGTTTNGGKAAIAVPVKPYFEYRSNEMRYMGDCPCEKKYLMDGYFAPKTRWWKHTCNSIFSYEQCIRRTRDEGIQTANDDPISRYKFKVLREQNICPACPMLVRAGTYILDPSFITGIPNTIIVRGIEAITSLPMENSPPYLFMSWDIETHDTRNNREIVPLPEYKTSRIFMICCNFHVLPGTPGAERAIENTAPPLREARRKDIESGGAIYRVCISDKPLDDFSAEEQLEQGYFAGNAEHIVCSAEDPVCREKQMIEEFTRVIARFRPDFIIDFNGFKYDWRFVKARGDKDSFRKLATAPTRITREPFEFYSAEIKLEATDKDASIVSKYDYFAQIDMHIYAVRRDRKESEGSKLQNFLTRQGLAGKFDLSYEDMRAKYVGGDPSDIKTIAQYCYLDGQKTFQLYLSYNGLVSQIAVSEFTGSSFANINVAADSQRILNALMKFIYHNAPEYALSTRTESITHATRFIGAKVLDPEVGLEKQCVFSLDFASLYPSIFCALNISPDTFIENYEDPRLESLVNQGVKFYELDTIGKYVKCKTGKEKKDTVIRHVDIHCLFTRAGIISHLPDDSGAGVSQDFEYSRGPTDEERAPHGIFPRFITSLLQMRLREKDLAGSLKTKLATITREKYNETNDGLLSFDEWKAKTMREYNNADARQLAYKIFINSIYGATGYAKASFYNHHIAAAITAIGRDLLDKTRKFCEIEHGCRVKYGDTDSLYMCAPKSIYAGATNISECINDTIKFAKDLAGNVNTFVHNLLGNNILNIDFENVFYPFFSLAKKKYFGIPFTNMVGTLANSDFAKMRIYTKGVASVRRGEPNIIKEIVVRIMRDLMNPEFTGSLKNYAVSLLRELYDKYIIRGDCTIDNFVAFKKYRADKNSSEARFVQIYNDSNPEKTIDDGERFPVVIGYPRNVGTKAKLFDKYIRLEDVKSCDEIDMFYYFKNKLSSHVAKCLLAEIEGETLEKRTKTANAFIKNIINSMFNSNEYIKKVYGFVPPRIYASLGNTINGVNRFLRK